MRDKRQDRKIKRKIVTEFQDSCTRRMYLIHLLNRLKVHLQSAKKLYLIFLVTIISDFFQWRILKIKFEA